jgi:hypothetical protein
MRVGIRSPACKLGIAVVLVVLAVLLLLPAQSRLAPRVLQVIVNVHDAQSGAPIDHASVTLRGRFTSDPEKPNSSLTGPDGSASVGLSCIVSVHGLFGIPYRESIILAGYELTVSHSGFATKTVRLTDALGNVVEPSAIEQSNMRVGLSRMKKGNGE